jgi:hypothetical protein
LRGFVHGRAGDDDDDAAPQSRRPVMDARVLRRYVGDLLGGRRPEAFCPEDFEAAQIRTAIDLRAARLGSDRPRREFLSDLHRWLAVQMRGPWSNRPRRPHGQTAGESPTCLYDQCSWLLRAEEPSRHTRTAGIINAGLISKARIVLLIAEGIVVRDRLAGHLDAATYRSRMHDLASGART